MKTTLKEIRKYHPCGTGWIKLLNYLGKTKADDDDIDFAVILKAIGIEDTVWCLRTQDFQDYCLFLADVAESVLLIFEGKHPTDDRPRKAIDAIRAWHRGKIARDDLVAAAAAAYAAAAAATYAADAAAYTAYTAAADVAYTAAYTAATAHGYGLAFTAGARKAKWAEIENMFVAHFVTREKNDG